MQEQPCVTTIYDVITRDLSFTLHNRSPHKPLAMQNVALTPMIAIPRPGSAVFAVAYGIDVLDSKGTLTVKMRFTLAALCATAPQCTRADLEQFASKELLRVLHPYLAETVHTFTGHLGIPPPLIGPFNPSSLKI